MDLKMPMQAIREHGRRLFFFFLEFAGEVIQHGSHEQRGDAVNNQYGLRWLIGGDGIIKIHSFSSQSIGDLHVFSIKVYILIAKSISVAIVFFGSPDITLNPLVGQGALTGKEAELR